MKEFFNTVTIPAVEESHGIVIFLHGKKTQKFNDLLSDHANQLLLSIVRSLAACISMRVYRRFNIIIIKKTSLNEIMVGTERCRN